MWSGTGYGEAARNAVLALAGIGARPRVDPTGFSKGTISVTQGAGGARLITGYRHVVNRALKIPFEVRELIARVQYHPVAQNAPRVVHAPSTVFERYVQRGRPLVGYTAWETGKMPYKWVDGCNTCDEIWIPCFHNVQALRDSGVTRPIFVVPHPIDTQRFAPSPVRLNGMFTFISVFRWGLRKGWPELFAAYEWAFTADDPVTLRVLTNYRTDEHRAEAQRIQEHFLLPGKPRLEILPMEYLTYDFMPVLYQNADAFVLPSRGEGFCLPCAEAMSSGIPAIVTDCTAFRDYVNASNGYLVGGRMVASEDVTDPDRDKSAWFVADIDNLAEQMLRCFQEPEDRRTKGVRARQTIQSKFSFERVARLMCERVAAIG